MSSKLAIEKPTPSLKLEVKEEFIDQKQISNPLKRKSLENNKYIDSQTSFKKVKTDLPKSKMEAPLDQSFNDEDLVDSETAIPKNKEVTFDEEFSIEDVFDPENAIPKKQTISKQSQ